MSRKFGAFNPASTVSTINTVTSTSLTSFYASFDSDANDEGPNSLTATLDGHSSGTASISTSDKQYGAGSLNIDGGDFVTYSTGLSLGESNFTVQFWLYLDEASSGSEYLVTNFNLSTTRGWYINLFPNNNNSLSFSWNDGDYRHFYINSSILTTGQWEHIAYVYDASAHSMEIYLDGVAQTVTNYNISSSIGSSARNVKKLQIADNDGADAPNRSFNGRMDDLRITRTKEYTSNFTPPSAALGAGIATSTTDTRSHSHVWNYSDVYKGNRADTWPELAFDTQIALYLPFNGSLTDFSSYGHTVSAVGDAAVTTSPFQFHGSCAFDGNGDLLTVPHNNIFDFGGNDFTIEGFINPTTAAGVQGVYSQWGGTGSRSFKVVISTNAKLEINGSKDGSTGTQVNQIASTGLELNTFSHFAVTRDGSNFRIFINGVNRGTTTDSGALYNSSANIAIGGNRADQTTNTLHGNLEDFRVINGLALYTTAFEVPTRSINNTLTVNP